ncbi:MAG: hypothetical protein Q8Q24_01815 [bacterium]|nr:hypothetical protein [bacterium]
MKNTYLIIFILVFTLALAKVLLTAKLATSGTDLAKIEVQTQQITGENRQLKEEIVSLSSLNRIASEAAKLGFNKTGKVVTLGPDVPIALKQ